MLTAQVISQQNTQTENQNVVTIYHIKTIFKNSIKIENIENIKNIRYLNKNIGYISDIYQ